MSQPRNAKMTIAFDLGGVLIDWNPRYLYRRLMTDEAAMERFLAEVCNHDWNVQQDAGRPFAEAVRELIERHPDQAELITAYHTRWPEMLGGPIAGTVEILRELKAGGHPVYALSNWSAETFPHALARYEFLRWFDGIVLSGEVGLIKPDPRIFQLLLERAGRAAGECLFIDDVPENVEAARRAGLAALHFQSPEQLRVQLQQSGIL